MSTTTEPIQGLCREHDADRIIRRMTCLVMAELPTIAREHPEVATQDLVESATTDVCDAYSLDISAYGPSLITRILAHLVSYFPDREPDVVDSASSTTSRNLVVTRVAFLDELNPIARAALLRRSCADFDPASGLASEIEEQIARYERLYGTIHAGVYRGLRYFGGIDYAGRRTNPEAWKTAPVENLVKEIMTSIRTDLGPVLSDVIVKEMVAFTKRHNA